MSEIQEKKRGRPKVYATKEEHNKVLYQRHKEKHKEYAETHKEQRSEYALKGQKKYREGYKLLIKIIQDNKEISDPLKEELKQFKEEFKIKDISL